MKRQNLSAIASARQTQEKQKFPFFLRMRTHLALVLTSLVRNRFYMILFGGSRTLLFRLGYLRLSVPKKIIKLIKALYSISLLHIKFKTDKKLFFMLNAKLIFTHQFMWWIPKSVTRCISAGALVLSINSHYNTGSLCGRDDQKSNLGLLNGT